MMRQIVMRTAGYILMLVGLAVHLHAEEVRFGEEVQVRRADIRVVNGKSVDVGPVHAWLRERTGERPMKHWKRLQVYTLKGNVSTLQQCVVKTEDGTFEEILVKNLPPGVSRFLVNFKKRESAIARLQEEISVHQAQLRREEAVVPTPIEVPRRLAIETQEERAKVNLSGVLLQEKQELLASMLAEHEADRAKGPELTAILAMHTGKTFGKLAVWDCGSSR